MIEHLPDYALGTGDLQQPGIRQRSKRARDRRQAAADWPLGYDSQTGVITLGRIQVSVAEACEQAKLLQFEIWQSCRAVQPR